MILKILPLLEMMTVAVVLVIWPYPQRRVPGTHMATFAFSAQNDGGPLHPLSLGKLEESCCPWVYVSSFQSYALEGKAEYFLITEERKATGHNPWNGKGMISSYVSRSWQEVT